jgi:riboflavin kinase / FMN adenylyltransferase
VESYILNFTDDIYGEAVQLSFVRRIRSEVKFTSVDALMTQIRQDVSRAEEIFRALNLPD